MINRGNGLLVLACALAACGDTTPAVDTGAADAGPETASSGARSLSTCTTNIAAEAPAFYRTYFKCVTITMNGGDVVIATDSLPPHRSYYYGSGDPSFEAFDTSRGAEYRPNPNKLSARPFSITVPSAPVAKGLIVNAALVDGAVGTSKEEFGLGPVGVALDSVALFNPLARPGDDIEAEKFTFDAYDAHPAPDGTYHYHRGSRGPLEVLASVGAAASVELYGIMCDGTVVLGCTELDGTAATQSALDAQGGHVGDLKDASGTLHFTGRYHTHVCPTGRKYTPEIQYYTACSR
jgi:hypothetical protein